MAANGAFPLADGSQIIGAPIVAADLTALQNYNVKLSTMRAGQWAYALNTGKTYQYTVIANPPTTPHTLVEFSTSSGVTGTTETLTITTNGQTSFTLAHTPTNIFGVILNEGSFVKYGTDFTVLGNVLTWLNPNGITIDLGDTAYFLYAYTPSAPVPITKYVQVPALTFATTTDTMYPFVTTLTSTGTTTQVVYTFDVPPDFISLVSFIIPGFVGITSAGGGPYNYTFVIGYAMDGELTTAHSTSVVKAKDFTGITVKTLQKPMFDLTSTMTSILAPSMKIGIAVVSDRTHQVNVSGAVLAYI